jgi:hypothetical protein
MKGMLCMMGLDQGRAGISLWIIELSGRVIFNKLY